MKESEIKTLASLARIRLSADEVAAFESQLTSIVSYVSAVQDIAADSSAEASAQMLHNVTRADAVTNVPEQYTDAITAEMPQTHGRHLVVKKILEK
jgi:aspartyl/glutamyl-tRNA(Asn/Gln) amidotransferase C subunit